MYFYSLVDNFYSSLIITTFYYRPRSSVSFHTEKSKYSVCQFAHTLTCSLLVGCRFPPRLTGGPYNITIDETQALLEEILRITATDNDTIAPHNQIVFELVAQHQWFGLDVDGKLFVKQVRSFFLFRIISLAFFLCLHYNNITHSETSSNLVCLIPFQNFSCFGLVLISCFRVYRHLF